MRPMFRPTCRLLAALGATSACSASVAPAQAPTQASTEAPEAEVIPADRLQADFDHLYAQLREAHYDLYARSPKAEYDAVFASMRAGMAAPLPRPEAERRFRRFVAFGRVAHARIDLPFERWAAYREAGGKALPLFLRVDGDQVYVLHDLSGVDAISPGDRVLAVDGRPALDWLRQLGEQVSADTDYMLFAQMEGLVPLLGWLAGEVDGVELTLAGDDGTARDVWLPARTRVETAAVEAAEPSQGVDLQGREAKMLDGGIAYLRPGPFYDIRPEATSPWDRSAFRAFLDGAFEAFRDAGATDLLIDLRDNPGGDNSFSDLLVAWFADEPFRFSPAFDIRVSDATVASNRARLDGQAADAGNASAELAALYEGKASGSRVSYPIPLVHPREGDRFDGRVHVLVNRHTYSNAVSVAAIVQDYGFGRVLGEETSDLATTLGAMEQFTLSGTGLVVGYPKARIVRPSGGIEARGVVPDVVLPRPVVEGAEDPVLLQALALIEE